MGIIYKLEIGNYHYYGKTTTRFSTRYNAHKKSCFNRSKRSYWTKLYVKIRELGVKKSQWNEKVKYKIIYKDCEPNEVEYYEFSCINTSNPFNLNTMDKSITAFYTKEVVKWGTYNTPELRKEYRKEYNSFYDKSDSGKKTIKKKRDKYNQSVKGKEVNKKYWTKRNAKRYYCECCQQEMSINTSYSHNKTVKHLTNQMEWIE